MYRTRFMILVLRCLLYLVRCNRFPEGAVHQEIEDECQNLIQDLKQHGGE